MKKQLIVVAIAFVAVAGARVAAQTQAAALPTVDQVIEKWVAALGGRAAMEKHTSRVQKGTIESPSAPITGTLEVSEKAPDKTLSVFNIAAMGVVREGFDGSVGWQDDAQSGLKEKTGKELADARRDAVFNSELKLKELYKTFTVTQETVGGRPAYLVVATPAEGNPTRYWLAVDTGLLIRTRVTRETAQGPVDIDVFLEDYRDVDGVKTPFTIRQVTPMLTLIFKVSEVKFNVALDDAIFKKPGTPGLR